MRLTRVKIRGLPVCVHMRLAWFDNGGPLIDPLDWLAL